MPGKISVLITGATGNAGSGVLKACMDHPRVKNVVVLARRPTGKEHEKLTEVIPDDFLDYSKVGKKFRGLDACYWCLGVSQSKVRNEADYTRITYDYTMAAAKVLEKHNPGMTFCYLTGVGSDSTGKSRWMWARVKGRTAKHLRRFNFKVYDFRPGFIHPIKGQKSGTITGTIFYPFIKNSRKWCVEGDEFGRAMINATLYGYEKDTLENVDIRELASGKGRG